MKDKMREAKFPIKNKDGKILWLNFFKMDWFSLLFMGSVLLILLGTYPIAKYAQECVENPCNLCYQKQNINAMRLENQPIDYIAIRAYVMNTTNKTKEGDTDGEEKSIL